MDVKTTKVTPIKPWNYSNNLARGPYVTDRRKSAPATPTHFLPTWKLVDKSTQTIKLKPVKPPPTVPPPPVKPDDIVVELTEAETQTEKEKRNVVDRGSSPILWKPPGLNPPEPKRLPVDPPKKTEAKPPTKKSTEWTDDLWNNMVGEEEPRMIVSVTGSSSKSIWKQWPVEKFHKAIYEATNNCRKGCGVIFNLERTPVMKNIAGNFVQLLPPLDKCTYSRNLKKVINAESHAISGPVKGKLFEDVVQLTEFENIINKNKQISVSEYSAKSEYSVKVQLRVPVVLIVIHGDIQTLENVVRATQHDISVTVVKGSGGAADLIASCYNNMEDLRRKIPVMLELRLDNQLYAKIEKVMKTIRERHWLVNTFDANYEVSTTLWRRITNGILRARAFEGMFVKTGNELLGDAQYFEENFASISTHIVQIDWLSRQELFGGFSLQNEGKDYFENLLLDALKENNKDILNDLLKKNVNISVKNLLNIYSMALKDDGKADNSKLLALLKRVNASATLFLQNGKMDDKESLIEDPRKGAEILGHKLLKGMCMARFGMVTCCNRRIEKEENENHNEPKSPGDENIGMTPTEHLDLLLHSVLTSNREITGTIWCECDHPMYSALIASAMLEAMAERALETAEDRWIDGLKEHSHFKLFNDESAIFQPIATRRRLFLERAIFVLEELFNENPKMATTALKHVDTVWGFEESPLHFGHHFVMEKFISHEAAQKDANNILYDGTSLNSPLDFIKDVFKRERPISSSLSAPFTKLFTHFLFYIVCLVCFGIFITRDLKMEAMSIYEAIVTVIVFGDFIEEMWTMWRPKDETGRWSIQRVLLHIMDVWNIMDLVFYILYLTAFLLHLSELEDLLIHTRRVYSAALFIMFLRLFNILLMVKSIGIMIIMVKEMLIHLLKFLVLAMVLMCAAGTVYQANVFPNHRTDPFPSIFEYWRIWNILKIPYWQMYGELNLETLEGNSEMCTNNATIWLNDVTEDRCPQSDWLAEFIAAVYMMLVHWLLLNIVIAMFSTVYDDVRDNSEQKWRYYRHKVIIEYEHRMPSPVNIIVRPIICCFYIRKKLKEQCKEDKQDASIDNTRTDKKVTVKDVLKKQKELAEIRIKEEETSETGT